MTNVDIVTGEQRNAHEQRWSLWFAELIDINIYCFIANYRVADISSGIWIYRNFDQAHQGQIVHS